MPSFGNFAVWFKSYDWLWLIILAIIVTIIGWKLTAKDDKKIKQERVAATKAKKPKKLAKSKTSKPKLAPTRSAKRVHAKAEAEQIKQRQVETETVNSELEDQLEQEKPKKDKLVIPISELENNKGTTQSKNWTHFTKPKHTRVEELYEHGQSMTNHTELPEKREVQQSTPSKEKVQQVKRTNEAVEHSQSRQTSSPASRTQRTVQATQTTRSFNLPKDKPTTSVSARPLLRPEIVAKQMAEKKAEEPKFKFVPYSFKAPDHVDSSKEDQRQDA